MCAQIICLCSDYRCVCAQVIGVCVCARAHVILLVGAVRRIGVLLTTHDLSHPKKSRTHTHARARTHTHTHTQVLAQNLMPQELLALQLRFGLDGTHTHARTHTRTHTHTHTHWIVPTALSVTPPPDIC